MSKDLRGQCWSCPYYIGYQNFCTFYNIELAAEGFEATCNNQQRIIKENEQISDKKSVRRITN